MSTLDKFIVGKEEFIQQEQAIKNAISNLRPTFYLKNIVKTESSHLIEISDQDNNVVAFEYGFTQPTWNIITGDPATNAGLVAWLNANYIPLLQKGEANGVATLDANGHIPTSQIAGSVAEVIEGYFYNNEFYADSGHTVLLPHNTNGIYYDLANAYKQYRWTGSAYVAVSTTVALNTSRSDSSATNAYRADFGASNYADIQTLQSTKQPIINDTNKLNPSFIATDANNRFVEDTDISNWNAKQDHLTFDGAPTSGSNNPVTSQGIKTYVDSKIVGALIFKGSVQHYNDLPTPTTTPDLETGWEYNVIDSNNLYAAVVDRTTTPHSVTWSLMGNSVSLQGYVAKIEKNIANGYAGLDEQAKISSDVLPDFIKKGLLFGGVVNMDGTTLIANVSVALQQKLKITDANIIVVNSPTDNVLVVPKQYGYVSLEGVFFNAGNSFSFASKDFNVGDLLISIGTGFDKIDHTAELDGKLDKVSTVNVVYANDASGSPLPKGFDTYPTANTMMQRDNHGRSEVEEPTTDKEIVNKVYLEKSVKKLATAPTTATTGEVGQLALVNDGSVYQLESVSGTDYTWVKLSKVVVEDSLTSTDTTKALSAAKGKDLKDAIDNVYTKSESEGKFVDFETDQKISGKKYYETTGLSQNNGVSFSIEGVKQYEYHAGTSVLSTQTEYKKNSIIKRQYNTSGVSIYSYTLTLPNEDGTIYTTHGGNIYGSVGISNKFHLHYDDFTENDPLTSKIYNQASNYRLVIYGANSWDTGAFFELYGDSVPSTYYPSEYNNRRGQFTLGTGQGTSGNYELIGQTNGELLWKHTISISSSEILNVALRDKNEYANQTRAMIFAKTTSVNETIFLNKVLFTDAESPSGSSVNQFECEVHRTGVLPSEFGYIFAKNRTGFYVCNIYYDSTASSTIYSDWTKVAYTTDVAERVKKVNSGNVTLIKASSDTASNRFVITAGTTDTDSCLIMKNKTASGGAGAWLRAADNNDTTNTKIHAFMLNGDGSVRFGSGAPNNLAWTGTNATGIIGDSGWATIDSNKLGTGISGTFKIRIKNGWVYISGCDINVNNSSSASTMLLIKDLGSISINQIAYNCTPAGMEARGIMKTEYGMSWFAGCYAPSGGSDVGKIIMQCNGQSITSQKGRFDIMYPYQ